MNDMIQIRTGICQSRFGKIYIWTFDNKLSNVSFQSNQDKVINKLTVEINDLDQDTCSHIIDVINNGVECKVPIHLVGTSFQIKVWNALREIPRGKTISYKELATSIGMPKAYRAVANAVGANPIAVIVPCHRVIRSDGSLGGYRWGEDRKEELLIAEASWLANKEASSYYV